MATELKVRVEITKHTDPVDLGEIEKNLRDHLALMDINSCFTSINNDCVEVKFCTSSSFDEISNHIRELKIGNSELMVTSLGISTADGESEKSAKNETKKVKRNGSKTVIGDQKKPEDVTATLSQNLPAQTSEFAPSSSNQFNYLDVTRLLVPHALWRDLQKSKPDSVASIQKTHSVYIDFGSEAPWQSEDMIVTVHGSPSPCYEACKEFLRNLYDSPNSNTRINFKHLTYDFICGRIIGKEGRNLKKIIDETKAKIMFSNTIYDRSPQYGDERVVQYDGTFDDVMNAFKIISHRIRELTDKQLSTSWDYSGMYAPQHQVASMSAGYFISPHQAYYMSNAQAISTGTQDFSAEAAANYSPYMMQPTAAAMSNLPYFGLSQAPTYIPTLPLYSAVSLEHVCSIESGIPYDMLGSPRSEGHDYVMECFVQVPLESVPFIETRERIIRDHYSKKNVTFQVIMSDKSVRTIIAPLQGCHKMNELFSTNGSSSSLMIEESGVKNKSSAGNIETADDTVRTSQVEHPKSVQKSQPPIPDTSGGTTSCQENVSPDNSHVASTTSSLVSTSSLVHYRIVGNGNTLWDIQLRIFSGVANAIGTPDPRLKIEAIIPGFSVGRIIGKNGSVVNNIQENSGAYVQVPKDRQGGTTTPVIISGTFFSIQCALIRIRDIVHRTKINKSDGRSTPASAEDDARIGTNSFPASNEKNDK